MSEKKLVFDVVFLKGDNRVFELRIKETFEFIDYFLIFGDDKSLKEILTYIPKNSPNISTFNIDGEFVTEDISEQILKFLEKNYKTFEDLVLFSFSNEIPNLKDLTAEEIKSKEVIVFKNDVYQYHSNLKQKFGEAGTTLTNFSHLLKNKKNFLVEVLNSLSNRLYRDTDIVNGKKFLFSESSSHTTYKCPYSNKTIEFKKPIEPRKFIFFFGDVLDNDLGDFNFDVKFTNQFPESIDIGFGREIQKIQIYQPNNKIYGNNQTEFEFKYKTFEVLRILSFFNCQDEDNIVIYQPSFEVQSYKFSQIKNPSYGGV